MRVGRLSHFVCLLIDPVVDERIVATRLLQQLNDFRDLLFAKGRQLQGELLPPLSEIILAPLGDEDQEDHVERANR